MRIAGIDIGGTTIKIGVFNPSGKRLQYIEYDTESHLGGNHILRLLIERIESFKNIDAIGVSSPGQIDKEAGVIINELANIPGTAGLQIKSMLKDYFHVPVAVENDVHAAALGEIHFGKREKLSDFLFLTYGTGIGGAIVIDSRLYYGRAGFAAEFGHIITHRGGALCTCGIAGCYEAYASTSALIKETMKIDPTFSNGRIICKKYYEGDSKIIEVVEKWLHEVVIGLVSLIHIFNPETIILGGGIMEQEVLIRKINEKVNEKIISSFRPVQIKRATLGNQAGMLGAVSLHLKEGLDPIKGGK